MLKRIGKVLLLAAGEISNQQYEFRGDKLETKHKSSVEQCVASVNRLSTDLRHKQRVNPGTNSATGHAWLEKEFSPTKSAKVFVYRQFDAASDLDFKTEGYVFDGGTVFHTLGGVGSTGLGRVEENYNDTYRRIKARDNWAVPGRPALLVIEMRDSVGADQKQTLTSTLPELRAQLSRMPGHVRILREGKRQLAGMNAEEVLFELKEGDVTSYRFYLLAPGDPSALAKPHTAIQRLLGANSPDLTPDQATSPVDETGALQVWDTLLNSVRLRPGAV
ncbi:hypothetical protein G3N57_01895 [Paraburkholderia sp. Se-20369]|nr:hypothetical protein [Paraburkholderia sp. Se-20369]